MFLNAEATPTLMPEASSGGERTDRRRRADAFERHAYHCGAIELSMTLVIQRCMMLRWGPLNSAACYQWTVSRAWRSCRGDFEPSISSSLLPGATGNLVYNWKVRTVCSCSDAL